MKKLLSLLVVAFLFFGCQGPEGPIGPPGPGTNWDVSEWNVQQWTLSSNKTYYYADLKVPKLTPFVASDGNVFVYLYTDSANGIQTPLPYVSHKTNGTNFWTETNDFDFTPGSIRLYVQYSDFATQNIPPASKFRVVLNW